MACLCAFVLGGVPFALVVVRLLKGTDIRRVGSGNVGATNASRVFTGRPRQLAVFLLIYALDAGKGALPAWFGLDRGFGAAPLLAGVLLGAAAVLGHVFSPFLGGKGGKGVSTATGALVVLDWQLAAVAVAAFLIVRLATRQVFLGSLALGLVLALASILLHPGDAFAARLPLTVLCLLLSAFLFWTHRSNLQRFLARGAGGLP